MANAPLGLFDEVGVFHGNRITVGAKPGDDRGHGEIASVDDFVDGTPPSNVFSRHPRSPHADEIHAGNAVDLLRDTPRWNIDRSPGMPLHESAFANSTELVNRSTTAHDDAVAYGDMTAKCRTVGHLDVVADL